MFAFREIEEIILSLHTLILYVNRVHIICHKAFGSIV